jgi:hypothetical protein
MAMPGMFRNVYIIFLLVVIVITMFVVLTIAFMPVICSLQLYVANNAPYTFTDKLALFHGLLTYLFLLGLPVLTIFYSTMPLRLYYIGVRVKRISYRSVFKKELWLFYIPFATIYSISAIIFYILSLVIEPVFSVKTYILVSDLTVLALIIFNVYVSIYAVWRIFINKSSTALLEGFVSSFIASLIGIIVLFCIHGFGDYYIYKCDPSSIGITVVNPYTYVFAEADNISLSKLVASVLWLIVFILLYVGSIKRYYDID